MRKASTKISVYSLNAQTLQVLENSLSKKWGGEWSVFVDHLNLSVNIIHQGKTANVPINFCGESQNLFWESIGDAAQSLVPQQALDDAEYTECFDAFMARQPADPPKPEPPPFQNDYCFNCGRRVGGWKPMFGALAPEWWATMREQGIDPATGHFLSCGRKLP